MIQKLKDISVWYKFRPRLEFWTSKMGWKTNTYAIKYHLYDETWYGEGSSTFIMGYYFCFNLHYFSIHGIFSWWKSKL